MAILLFCLLSQTTILKNYNSEYYDYHHLNHTILSRTLIHFTDSSQFDSVDCRLRIHQNPHLQSRDTIRSINFPIKTGGVQCPNRFLINPQNDKIYIIGTDRQNIAICDLQNGGLLATISTNIGTIAIEYSDLSNKIYCIVNNWLTPGDTNKLLIIDGTTNFIIKSIPLSGAPISLAYNNINNYIYVSYENRNWMDVFDCSSDSLIAQIDMNGYGLVWEMIFNHQNNKIYCPIHTTNGNRIAIINCLNNSVVANIPIAGTPIYFACNSISNKIYSLCQFDNMVYIINGSNDSLLATRTVGDWPNGIAYNPVMNRIYICNANSQDVCVLDGDNNEIINTIPLSEGGWAIAYDSLDNVIVVAGINYSLSTGNGDALVIDCPTDSISACIPVGIWPQSVKWDKEMNRIWIGNTGTTDNPGYTIESWVYNRSSFRDHIRTAIGFAPYASLFNSTTGKHYSTSLPDGYLAVVDMNNPDITIMKMVGMGGFDLILNPDNNKIYITLYYDNMISIVEGINDSVINRVPVGRGPINLALNRTNNKIYSANIDDNNLTVIDGQTNNVINTMSVGDGPRYLLWNQINNKLYVSNCGDSSMTILDAYADTVITTLPVSRYPYILALNTVNNKIYCVNYFDSKLTVVDGITDQIHRTINLGNGVQPSRLAYNPINNKIYCFTSVDSIVVIDGITDSILRKIPTPGPVFSMMYNPINNRLFCAYYLSWSEAMMIIDGETDGILFNMNFYTHIWVAGLSSPAEALAFDSQNNIIYLSHWFSSKLTAIDGNTGLNEISSIRPAGNISLLVYPNPSRTFINIGYLLNNRNLIGKIKLRIYDASGRLVRNLKCQSSSNTENIVWNGKDDLERLVPNGIYFIGLYDGDISVMQKIIYLR